MEQEFKQKVSSYKSSIIKDIITIIIKDYYDNASEEDYYFEEIFGEKFKKMEEENMYGWFWEDGIKEFENYAKKYAPKELYNYFVWKWYSYANFCYEEDEESISTEHNEDFFEQLENMSTPPEKENLEQEENPFTPSAYIDKDASLKDDNNFNSLLKSLETIINFENELLKRKSTEVNENPYQSDWDKIEQMIINAWIKTIMDYKNTINIVRLQKGVEHPKVTFLGINPDNKEQTEELIRICKFKIFLEENPLYAYRNYFEIWQSLYNSKHINKKRLNEILKELETSTNLEEVILNILDNDEGIYFICAVPYMKNLRNKATCILVFNLIFNSQIEFKEFIMAGKEKIFPTKESVIEALNSGFTLEEIPGILERIHIYIYEFQEYQLEYGFDPNMQDEQGNTLLMHLLITTQRNVLNQMLFSDYREKILMLLKLDFSLSLQNNEGLNTYDIVIKYRADDEELVEIISKIYGFPYDKTTIEFHKEVTRVRTKAIEEKLIEKF